MNKKKILIIGRMYSDERALVGPAAVIKALVKELHNKKIHFSFLEYNSDKISKLQYIKLLFKEVFLKKDLIVNVHTEGFLIPFIIYFISILNPKNQYFLTVHGIYIMDTKFRGAKIKFLKRLQEEIIIKNFQNIICVSEMLKKDIERHFNRSKNVFVVNNGIQIEEVPFEKISVNNSEIKLIITGGVKKIKGVFEALDLVEYLNSKLLQRKAYLEVYGGIDNDNTLKEFKASIASKGLDEYVKYNGIIKEKRELYEKYKASDLNLCISHYDTFNAAIIEAMACGTPTIASKNCGASYLIEDTVDGFVVDMDNNLKEKIFNIISSCVNDKERFNSIREKAYHTARLYSWAKSAENYLDVVYKTNIDF